MPKLESAKRLARRWLTSIPFFVVLGLALGVAISIPVIPKPEIAIINISGIILEQAYTDDILDMLRYASADRNIKAVVLQIDSPGGYTSTTEQIYLDVLRLRVRKPVVASVGMTAASGGYYIAVASNFIYAQPSSIVGSVGARVLLPTPEKLDEDIITTGPFKIPYESRRKALSGLETLKQQFVDENTFSSLIETRKGLSPIALAQESKVLAIYDLTFITEPHNGILDNNQLISNIADWLASPTEEEVEEEVVEEPEEEVAE